MTSVPPVEPDLEWCHDAVQGVSRTFALTVDVLEEPMSSHVCLGYLLCRVADTVEDAGHIPRTHRFDCYGRTTPPLDPDDDVTMTEFRSDVEEWLPGPADRNDDWSVVAQSPTIWATFADQPEPVHDAVVPPVREMVDGMAMFVDRHADVGGLRIDDRSELEEYCYYAAGTVGTLITNLLTRGEISQERARHPGNRRGVRSVAPLVNVSKDVYDDYTEENNVYLPAEWLADEGIDQDAVVDPDNRNPPPASSTGPPPTPRRSSTTPRPTWRRCRWPTATPSPRGRCRTCSASARSGNSGRGRKTR